ncbi:NAD(P)/FAD-dependent oxidoreductase [Streptomyces globisporus]|uniref:NAD(P)/FAD-dependent oxidoreductase n=1 Tax=Streptomyces globisporus TaxID=1908 RepID=UPI00379938F0
MLGGSITGTLAARVLSEFYRQVVIVDRDEILGVEKPRRGAPHAVHAHGLHGRGCLIVQQLFPNLLNDMRRARLPVGDLGEQRWYFNGRPFRPLRTGLPSLTVPRPVLEAYLRAEVAQRPNVTFLQNTELRGLLATPDRSRVTGARLCSTAPGSESFDLEADLVVDATGRGSRTPVWLQGLGYDRPVERRMPIGLAYTTRFYRNPPDTPAGPQFINCLPSPPTGRGAFLGHTGHGTRILSLTGLLGDHPPADPEDFTAFAKTLPAPEIHDHLRTAQPLTAPLTFRFPASLRRHYERLARFPQRLLVLGDAVCSLNPNYSQGMTVAALQAMALHQHLTHGAPDSVTFMRDVGRIIDTPWFISTTSDLRYTGTTGHRTLTAPAINAYVTRLHHTATHSPAATNALLRVAGLVDHPTALLRPRILLTTLRARPARPVSTTS